MSGPQQFPQLHISQFDPQPQFGPHPHMSQPFPQPPQFGPQPHISQLGPQPHIPALAPAAPRQQQQKMRQERRARPATAHGTTMAIICHWDRPIIAVVAGPIVVVVT